MIPNLRRRLLFILALLYTKETCASAYSNVYVQRGAKVPPLEFLEYGTPALNVPGAQLTRITLPSRPALSYGPPCAFPCVPSLPNQEITTYNSPSVPVVLETTNEVPSTYDYSYVVYDSNTGDQKSQRELSDGSSVQGQYSLMQPDGYIREVSYTADDLRGFNAIVKNFLPPQAEQHADHREVAKEAVPCHEVKNEQTIEAIHAKPAKLEASTPSTEPAHASSELPQISTAASTENPHEITSSASTEAAHSQSSVPSTEHPQLSSEKPLDHPIETSSAKPIEPHSEPPLAPTSGETHTASSGHTKPFFIPAKFPYFDPSVAAVEPPGVNEIVFQPAFHLAEFPVVRPIGTYEASNSEYFRCLQAFLEANQITGNTRSPLFIVLGGQPCKT